MALPNTLQPPAVEFQGALRRPDQEDQLRNPAILNVNLKWGFRKGLRAGGHFGRDRNGQGNSFQSHMLRFSLEGDMSQDSEELGVSVPLNSPVRTVKCI